MIYDMTNPVHALVSREWIPPMALVRQNFDCPELTDPSGALLEQISLPEIEKTIQPGMRIAITAGSRQLSNMVVLLRTLGAFLKKKGAQPFIIPGMGSHGGATAPGQIGILEALGITEESTGMPIRATMDTVSLDRLDDGTEVRMDRYAYEADGVILLNRVKPHTSFRGKYESGLMKMAVVGLGKQHGAEIVHHKDGMPGMGKNIESMGTSFMRSGHILFGIALVENSLDHTCEIHALLPEEIILREPALLEKARAMMPSIFLKRLDVLIVDQIGKNFSGAGMDPNITNSFNPETGIASPERPKRVVVLDLSKESHGAALGIGNADITTTQLVQKMDRNATYPNMLTAGVASSAKLPIYFDSHRMAIQAAIMTTMGCDKKHPRIARITDTLHLDTLWVSEALLDEVKADPRMEILELPRELPFNAEDNLF